MDRSKEKIERVLSTGSGSSTARPGRTKTYTYDSEEEALAAIPVLRREYRRPMSLGPALGEAVLQGCRSPRGDISRATGHAREGGQGGGREWRAAGGGDGTRERDDHDRALRRPRRRSLRPRSIGSWETGLSGAPHSGARPCPTLYPLPDRQLRCQPVPRNYRESVRSIRLELPHPCGYQNLNLARLPIPPRPLFRRAKPSTSGGARARAIRCATPIGRRRPDRRA